ncbi:hypothetical protein M1349_00885 [Patescibacteria group bacterium]|nr:hypothetical protein [Patescibacteria group bacterium]
MSQQEINLGGKPFTVVRKGVDHIAPSRPVEAKESTSETVGSSVRRIVNEARNCALLRIDQNSFEAKLRVLNALGDTLTPFVEENLIIADQISSERFKKHEAEITKFLNCDLGADLCPDGRIYIQSIAEARVLGLARTPMGLPKTRRSTGGNREYVIDDPDKAASIKIKIKNRLENGENPELVQFGGIHIDSHNPLHGCGAVKNAILEEGHPLEIAMADGGVRFYFNKFGHLLTAVENNARIAGGKATFVDMAHDSHNDSLIFGLKEALSNPQAYNSGLTLEHNLKKLHDDGEILMTVELDEVFKDKILGIARALGIDKLDSNDPSKFSDTSIALGTIAKFITQQEEAKGYEWIPDAIKEGKSVSALRSIAYISIRNTAYRMLCDIQPGEHDLIEHPEELMMVGPVTVIYHKRSIPFTLKTTRGPLQDDVVATAKTLYGMFGGFVKDKKNLETEGRIILVTGEHAPEIYSNSKNSDVELTRTLMTVMDNAALLREEYKESVEAGETIVLSVIMHPGTRQILQIV